MRSARAALLVIFVMTMLALPFPTSAQECDLGVMVEAIQKFDESAISTSWTTYSDDSASMQELVIAYLDVMAFHMSLISDYQGIRACNDTAATDLYYGVSTASSAAQQALAVRILSEADLVNGVDPSETFEALEETYKTSLQLILEIIEENS